MREELMMARERNERLAALLTEARWSRAQAALAFNRMAAHCGHPELSSIGRSHISMWVGGTVPSGAAPEILCQALTRRLRRVVTLGEAGFQGADNAADTALDWAVDPLISLTSLGGPEAGANRREVLSGAVHSIAGLVLPEPSWWKGMATGENQEPTVAGTRLRRIGRADVATVQDLTLTFSRIDQRRGGGHGWSAVRQYLHSDVTDLLRGRFPNEQVRRDMFAAAGELAYLAGWMAFDNSQHAVAQRYFALGVKLAARADNQPLAGHIMRAMAHQAIDLNLPQEGLALSTDSVRGQRYRSATPREKALLMVVHARGLAVNGMKREAAKALLQAEDALASASDGVEEPNRTFFFSEASLAHETACTLRDCGDLQGAIRQYQRSIRTRGAAFRRTHAVTLGYLASSQLAYGRVDEACATWSDLMNTLEEGIHSGRTRQAVVDMRRLLFPYLRRGIPAITELDARASSYLAEVD